MSDHDRRSSRRIWTEYWTSGRCGCLTDEAPASARDHIEALWRGWFLQCPRAALIIDLACGAGEVARIASSASEAANLHFAIDGVDLAKLPEGTGSSASQGKTTIRLHGGVDLARLPFADGSFDCAVSQFGIEYADREGAIRELARVLKPHARGLFLVHHSGSVISTTAASRLEAFAAVIGDGAVLDHARQTYETISAHAPEPVVGQRLRQFRQTLGQATDTYSRQFSWEVNLHEILGFLGDLARNPHMYDATDALRRLEAARETIEAWKCRQESQLAAAQDKSGMQAFAQALGGIGLTSSEIGIEKDPATGAVLAWRLEFARHPRA
ncbi:MAG TPA: class I SAM-dependent methyltransferase [Rhizomicrobium sp.]|nr:class I SAM-dependent methyltransferase [Rhizomicrobium sp.]